jgi:hypothetical protein
MFRPVTETLGVPLDENHGLVEWFDGEAIVVFSFARRGNALDCHFAANKKALRHLRRSFDDFCDLVKSEVEWCTMIIAIINKISVERFILKCKFDLLSRHDDYLIYKRNL